MSDKPKLHYADLIFGRPCCSAVNAPVTRVEEWVTCRRCRRILAECARAQARRAAEVAL